MAASSIENSTTKAAISIEIRSMSLNIPKASGKLMDFIMTCVFTEYM